MRNKGFYLRVTNGDTSIIFYTKRSLIKFIFQLIFCDMKKENVVKVFQVIKYIVTFIIGALGGSQISDVL